MTLAPGDFPDIPADPREVGGGNGSTPWWSQTMWPELWPKLILSYPTTGARDADLAGLGPTDDAHAYVAALKSMTHWNGSAWVVESPAGLGPMASGSTTVTLTSQSSNTAAVVFPVGRFATAPQVIVTARNSSYSGFSGTPTTSGCNVGAARLDGTNVSVSLTVSWIALAAT